MLTLGIVGMVILVLGCGIFLGLAPGAGAPVEAPPELPRPASQFFATPGAIAPHQQVPVELLLSQLEHHIRLEEAAAEAVLKAPTTRSLHARTISTLAN